MGLQISLLLLGYTTLLTKGQTLMLSACTRIGNERWCIDQRSSSVLWTSYALSTVPPTAPATTTASTTSAPTTAASSSSITAVSGCHMHETVQFCVAGTSEYQVMITATATEELPAQYTGCHAHGSELYCFDSTGEEYVVVPEGAASTESESEIHEDPDHESEGESTEASGSEGQNCHFHAGVEHCVGAGESESGGTRTCERTDRDYNVPLRIGLLFVVLVTSALAVFIPIFMGSYIQNSTINFCLMILKQFGTGVMVSTAFIHLLTHANLMLTNECIDYVTEYEGTAAAIMMAGLFIAFLIEYIGSRILFWRNGRHAHPTSFDGSTDHDAGGETIESGKAIPNNTLTTLAGCGNSLTNMNPGQEKLAVTVMETGIIFHSLLIGLTLVVSGDSFFKTLFIVIVFHQMFEGIALGARIAELPSTAAMDEHSQLVGQPVTMMTKMIMGAAFALVTPVGMAIGIGVLDKFNGNDPATLIAIGTLDAVSAGILAWVSLVEMWAADWMHGPLSRASTLKTTFCLIALMLGMALMSLLGKWA